MLISSVFYICIYANNTYLYIFPVQNVHMCVPVYICIYTESARIYSVILKALKQKDHALGAGTILIKYPHIHRHIDT